VAEAAPGDEAVVAATAAAGGSGRPSSSVEEPEASKEARLVAGLCIKHWGYGELASS
jgi:hypothetical protein